MPKLFRGFHLAGKLFLSTSFFIAPNSCRFESHLPSPTNSTSEFSALPVNGGGTDSLKMAKTTGKWLSQDGEQAGLTEHSAFGLCTTSGCWLSYCPYRCCMTGPPCSIADYNWINN